MKRINSFFNLKVGLPTALAIFAISALAVGFAPTVTTIGLANTSENCADNQVLNYAVLNPDDVFPVTWGNKAGYDAASGQCLEFAVIGIANQSAGDQSFKPSVSAHAGDTLTIRLFAHDGAATNSGHSIDNVRFNTNVDQSVGTSHDISTVLSGSGVASVTGSVSVNTDSNTHLELVDDASPSIGHMEPCFENSQQRVFHVRVVSNTPTGNNTLTAQATGQIGAQCLETGVADWTNSSDVTSAEVTVRDVTDSGSESVLARNVNGHADTPWLTPGHKYEFVLYNTTGGRTRLTSTQEDVPALNCNQNTTVTPQSFNLSISTVCVGQRSSVSLTNATDGLNGKQIFWTSTKNGASTNENLSGYNQLVNNNAWNGSTDAWTATEVGHWVKTASFVDNGAVIAHQDAGFDVLPSSDSRCGGGQTTQSFNLSITPNPVCVGSQSTVSITGATAGLNGKQVFWSSTKNGVSTGENLSGYNQFVNGGTLPNTLTSTWVASEIGNWTKTASFVDNGVVIASQQTSFVVKDCTVQTQTQTFSATADATATADASAFCPNGTSATAHSTGSGHGSATSTISQQDAQSRADVQARANAQASANATANAQASVNCGNPVIVIPPTTNNAQCVNISAPDSVTPGQTFNATVTFLNTGTKTWTQAAQYRIGSTNPTDSLRWGIGRVDLSNSPVAQNQNGTFVFSATAPTSPGTYSFDWKMLQEYVEWFGNPCTKNIVVQAPVVPTTNNAQCVNISAPDSVTPGQTFNATVTFLNTGTKTWTQAAQYRIGSTNPTDNLRWGLGRVNLPDGPVSQNQNSTFTFTATAPSVAGVYSFDWKMLQESVEWFGGTCNKNISVQNVVISTYTATATANANANATVSCPNGTVATASASATASATASSSISQLDAQNNAQAQAQARAQADAYAKAQVNASASCSATPVCTQLNFSAANSVISKTNLNPGESFNVSCDYGHQADSVNVSGGNCSFTGFNGTKANFNCSAPLSNGTYPLSCTLASGTSSNTCAQTNNIGSITVSSPSQVCTPNSNFALNFTNIEQNGIYFSATLQWSSTGGHSIKIMSDGQTLTTGGDTGTFEVNNLRPGRSYSIVMTDITCNAQLTSATLTLPQLIQPHPTPTPVVTNTINNNSNNNNTINNNVTGNNNNTVSNNTIINGDNNKVTNTNTCVNNSCNNIVYANTVAQTPALMCNPSVVQTVGIGQRVYFSATGGSGNYTWASIGASTGNGSGSSFQTSYNSSGDYVATVSDGITHAVCQVHVNAAQYQQLQCTPPSQTANVNQNVYFSATGGNGQFTWSANTASHASGSSQNFNTTFAASGYQTVNVSSGDGQTANCNVNILNTQPTQLVCSPGSQTVTSGQTVYFSVYGGNGGYTWSAPSAQNNTSGSGQNFNTTFNNSGNQTITVRSGDGQSANCYAYVNPTTTQNGYLLINKWVSHSGQGDFNSSITATAGSQVTYKIQVSAQNGTINNVQLSDYFSTGNANLVSGTVTLNGNYESDSWFNSMNLGTLNAGQSAIVMFTATVNSQNNYNQTVITNTAQASGSNTGTVTATATVFINQSVTNGNTNLVFSKRANNDTQNIDATTAPASKEDYITYTLTVNNTGSAAANNFVITDDLSQVLPYADMSDNGGGALSGNVLSFPGITIPAGGSVSKSFKVRVKYFLANNLNYQMRNTYGNSVVVNINTPQVTGTFIAPKTGADSLAVVFSTFLTAGFAAFKKRKDLMKLVLS